MNRKQFAQVVAHAYASDFIDANEETESTRIVFDSTEGKFAAYPVLIPLDASEVEVDRLADGQFGGSWESAAEIEDYLNDSASDEYWEHITSQCS